MNDLFLEAQEAMKVTSGASNKRSRSPQSRKPKHTSKKPSFSFVTGIEKLFHADICQVARKDDSPVCTDPASALKKPGATFKRGSTKDFQLSADAKDVLNMMSEQFLRNMTMAALKGSAAGMKAAHSLTQKNLELGARLTIPGSADKASGSLYHFSQLNAKTHVGIFLKNEGDKRMEGKAFDTKATLNLSVAKVREYVKQYITDLTEFGPRAQVDATARLEHILAEIMQMSIAVADEQNRKTVRPEDIKLVMKYDHELAKVFEQDESGRVAQGAASMIGTRKH